ncbi:MAG: LamG domain-containing protein [Candidatus Krumholzibacteriia bacterium]
MGFQTGPRLVAAAVATLLLIFGAVSRPAILRAGPFEDPLGHRLGKSTGNGSKPQSKIWYHDGSYWCVIDGPEGNQILELAGNRWRPQPDARLGSHKARADVLWNGSRLIVLLHAKIPRLLQFTYDRERRGYRLEAGYPVRLLIPAGSETMVIDEDSRGRLWASYVAAGKAWVAHSTADHRVWDLPGQVLREGLGKDDIGAVIAFGGARVGVMWSDQRRDEFGFRQRADADPLDVWGPVEVVHHGPGHADDHINLTSDSQGRVYAITKDDDDLLNAHMRSPSGKWTSQDDVLRGGRGTRPILMTAESERRIVVLYTRWYEGEQIIAQRASPLGRLQFGAAAPIIVVPGVKLRDVTGTKQALPSGSLAAIAYGQGATWWNAWGAPPGDGEFRPPQTSTMAAHTLMRCPDAALALAFDEAAGHEVADASVHAATGRLGGPWADDVSEPTWTQGVSGSALYFDGRRSFVAVEAVPRHGPSGSMTVEAWIRHSSDGAEQTILSRGAPGGSSYRLRLQEDDRLEFIRDVDGSVPNQGVQSVRPIRDGGWHHVAAVFDRVAKEGRIYIDGHLEAAAPDGGDPICSDDVLFIGARQGKKRYRDWFHGDIDQVRVTYEARYTSDFTPPMEFDGVGPARLFLTWTPRYPGPFEHLAYDVFRSASEELLPRLITSHLHATSCIDTPASRGQIVYEVHLVDRNGPTPGSLTVEWLPAAAPPVPPRPPRRD